MKTIIKIMGLPRTGTNVIHALATLNFKNYVCAKAEHEQDYLGWKHGVPQKIEEYLELEKLTNETIKFIFTSRNFESWKEAYMTRHIGSWENQIRFTNCKKTVFCTPIGLEIYNDLNDLHNLKMKAYQDFVNQNPSRAIIISFEDITENQENVVQKIKDKFNLELMDNRIFTIKKQLDSDGTYINYKY